MRTWTWALGIWSGVMLVWYIASFIWASMGVAGCDVVDASGHCPAVIGLGTTIPYSFIARIWLIGVVPLGLAWFASRQMGSQQAWQAAMVGFIALPAIWFAGYALNPLHHPAILVAWPVALAAAWLYRAEIRAGGWRSVAVGAVIALALALLLVSPSYLARLP